MEKISGIITRILKQDHEKNTIFAVIRYESDQGLIDSKISGPDANFSVNDFFFAEGVWKSSTFKGITEETFQSKILRPAIPKTKEGAVVWLSTLFNERDHGLSRAALKDLVEKLGDNAIALCEKNPKLLVDVSSNPVIFNTSILKNFGQKLSGRRAVSLMEEAKIDQRAIDGILDAFRDTAYEILQKDPYLAARVKNVGFLNADKIGSHMGISPEDSRRVQAALLEILDDVRKTGDTYTDIDYIGDQLQDRFNISLQTAVAFINQKASDENAPFVVRKSSGAIIVMPRNLYNGEILIAKNVCDILANGRRNNEVAAQSVLDKLFASEKYSKFDDIQKLAVKTSAIEPISILTGGPGTGKSTVSEVVVEASLKLDRGQIFLAAPTGKAAKRLQETTGRDACTVHSLLQARENKKDGSTIFGMGEDNKLPDGCVVLVDEASMLDIPTTCALVSAMPKNGRLILVGDKNQLPSVDAGSVLGDLLTSKFGDGYVVPATELQNVYRQSRDSRIATGAADVRQGKLPLLTDRFDGGLILYERQTSEVMNQIIWIVQNVFINRMRLRPQDFAILVPQAPGGVGTHEINKQLSKLLNPHGKVIPGTYVPSDDTGMPIPRVNDRIMLTENDSENDVMNGDTGYIAETFEMTTQAGAKRNMIRIQFDCGKTVDYPAALWRRLSLAYAITIHKSQGSQYTSVLMPVVNEHSHMLGRSLLYTGWTRAKQGLFLVGQREAIDSAVENVTASRRKTRLSDFLKTYADTNKLKPVRIGESYESTSQPKPLLNEIPSHNVNQSAAASRQQGGKLAYHPPRIVGIPRVGGNNQSQPSSPAVRVIGIPKPAISTEQKQHQDVPKNIPTIPRIPRVTGMPKVPHFNVPSEQDADYETSMKPS